MTTTDLDGPDLAALAALTRDYAAFQSRKSGLATALGGLLAVLLVIAALSPNFMGAQVLDHLFIGTSSGYPSSGWCSKACLAVRFTGASAL